MQQKNNSLALTSDDGDQNDDTLSLSTILHVFLLRRRLFLAVFIFIVLSGSIILFQLTPRYTTTTKILVGSGKTQVVDVDAVLSGDLNTDSAVKSETEVLTSRSLAKKVITKLNLLNLPEFNPALREKGFFTDLNPANWLPDSFKEAIGLAEDQEALSEEEQQDRLMANATDAYLDKVKAAPIRGSQVISVSVESTDPKLAAKIANTHADSYIIGQLEAKFDATQKASSWLNEQLSGLRAKVENSEKAVEIYRNQHNLSQGKDQSGLAGEQLSEINSQLIIAKAAKAEASARLAQVTQLLHSGDVETTSEVLSSTLIQNLRGQEAELARKVSEMSVELGSKHPKLIQINAEILDLREKIKTEIKKIAAGIKNELNIASAREASLQASLHASEAKSGSSKTEEVQLRALEREANANKLLFETFLNRYKETSSTQGMQEADARVISEAEVPMLASFPKKNLMLMLIAMLAAFVGTTVIFILEMLNPGLRTPEEIEQFLGLPAIGLIPLIDKNLNPTEYIIDKPHSSMSEAFNSLRVSLLLSDPDHQVKTIMVTSSTPSEGKSTLALCLGRSAALVGQRVVVIDADLRRPTIEKKLGLSTKAKGLTDLIMAKEKFADCIFKDPKTDLYIMPKGEADYVNPVGIFSSQRMDVLLIAMKERFDLIIFDTPPVMAVSDARLLSSHVDKTIFVVNWDNTPKKVVKAALNQLQHSEASIAGIVLQQVNLQQYGAYGDSGYYYHYSKYGQYYKN